MDDSTAGNTSANNSNDATSSSSSGRANNATPGSSGAARNSQDLIVYISNKIRFCHLYITNKSYFLITEIHHG